MSTEQVLANLEKTIKRVSNDIRRKKGAVGSDKLDALSKLTNSYSRLLERLKLGEEKGYVDGGGDGHETPMDIYRR